MDNSCKEKKRGRIKRLKRQKRLKGLKRGLGLFLSAAVVCNTLLFDASTVFAEEVQEQELYGVETAEEEEGTGKETAASEEPAKDEAAQEGTGKETAAPEEPAKDEAAQEEAVQEEPAKDEAVQDETIIKEETAQGEATKEETTAQEDTTKEDTAEEDTTKKEQTEEKGTQEETAEEMQDTVSAEDTGLCAHHKEHTAECGYSSPSEEGAGSPCTYVCRICPIEELIAALPEVDDVSGDNAEEVQAQLEKILALYTELSEEEQEQTDISRCLALQEALELLAGQGRAKTPALVLDAVTYLDYDAEGKVSEEKNCDAYEQISSETTTWSGSNEFNGWYVASGEVTISGRVTVTGDVHLILTNGCTLEAEAGITVNSGNSLTIYAQTGGEAAGSLTATATDDRNAGIGGENTQSGGKITINGGKIKADASGGKFGAGIGGGYQGAGGTITINGGVVEADGGHWYAAGIGGGHLRSGGKITINGGKVTAKTSGSGAGIGSGSNVGSGGEITINGGEVNATGGGSGAGIGGGNFASGGIITINGGTVTAAGGTSGAGIGGGNDGDGGEVTINGGTITATGGASGAGIGGGKEAAGGKITIVGGTVQATGGYSKYGGSGAHIGGGSSGDAGTIFIGGGTVTKGEGEPETYYTVSFVVADVPDVNVPAQGIAEGKTAEEPSFEIEGYKVLGWYRDETYNDPDPFDFTSETIDSNLTLYAKLEENTDYAVEVELTIDGKTTTSEYTTIGGALTAISGKTGVIKINVLRNVTATESLMVDSDDMDVTVEMAEGVQIDSTSDFFIVKMGKLTLNSGTYVSTGGGKSGIYMTGGSVVMNGGTIEMQGADTSQETKGIRINGSGTLTINGGELKVTGSNAIALLVDQGKVTLKGGTLTGTNNNKALVINDSTQDIGSLLGEDFKIYKSGVSLGNDELLGKTLEAGTYTVTDCIHSYGEYTHTTGTTVHERKCAICEDVEQTPCRYEWSDGNSKAVCSVCDTSCLTISTTGTEGLIYDGRSKEPSVTVTLDDESTLTEGYTVTYANNTNAGDGTASVTVEGKVFEGTFTQNFSIGKAKGTLTVPVTSFKKVVGDVDFSLNCKTNGDGEISYQSDKEDIVSVQADGTVQIKGAGTAHITVSLADGENYTEAADVTVTVNVAELGDYVAKVTTGGVETEYETIEKAWEAVQGHTATMTILRTQSLDMCMEITNADTDVTVEMADGVRLSTSDSSIFIVDKGKLTLNGGTYSGTYSDTYGDVIDICGGTVVVNDGSIETMSGVENGVSGIYIQSGTLNIRGGELKAAGIKSLPLVVEGGAVIMTGGTLTNDDGEALLLPEYSEYQNVGSLLGEGYKICKDGVSLTRDELNVKNLEAGTYTVEKCTAHSFPQYTHTAGTTVHEGQCDFCGNMVQEPCRYEWSAGNNTADCVCGSRLMVSTDGTEGLVYDGRSKEPSVTVTLDDGSKLTEGYTVAYTDNINAGDGTASVTVKGEVFEGTFTRNFSIGKAKGTLTVPAVSVEKTFGEADFPLNCTTNGDGQISYTSDKEAVAAILADGTVQIKGAGTAKITVSLAEGRNYTKAADAAVTVSVAKNGTYRVEEINRRYLYTRQHTGEVDLAALLPKDCGAVTYQTPSTSGNVAWKTASVDTEGKLSYTLANGNAGDKGTITVAVQTQNYEDITITVNVELTGRMPVSVKEGGEVTLKDDTLTYGETLSKLTFNEAVFVDSSMHDVAGALAWKNPSEMPEAGTVSATWVFTPSDDQYETLEGVIAITVRKAGAAPNLPDSAIEAPKDAEKVGDIPLPEGWEWQEADKETPLVPGMPVTAVAVYTGADKGNYETAAQTVTITKPDRSHTGLWVSGLHQSVPYTGSAVTQENIRVYHNSTLLQEKTEYTISYKNNVNAGTAQLIVTGKGNYTGKVTQEFTIEHIDLGAEAQNHIYAVVATAAATGKRLKPAVTVTWNGKKLKEKKDYTLSYDTNITSASADGYDVTISGVGNYSGSMVRKFRVMPKGTPLLNSAKVSGLAKSYPYRNAGDSNGDAVPDGLEDDLAKLSVKVGKIALTQGTDYIVRMENIGSVGTAALIIEPAAGSSYAGEKHVPVLITGTDLKKCSITGLEGAYPYTGAPVTPEIAVFAGKNGSGTQILADAYTIRYANNTKPGKATVTVTGIAEKGYSGTLKATYTIGRADLEKGEAAGTITIRIPDTVSYAKGGAKPKPVVMYTEGGASYTLRENIDYQLKYKNNTALSEGASRQPMVSIIGIGNYSGTVTKNFAVTRQDIGLLTIAAADKAYSAGKKGSAYYSAPKVYDLDGKLLKPKKDYTVRYTDDATGSEIDKTTVVENGTKIRVTVTVTQTAQSGYSGTLSTTYLVRSAESVKDITKAKADKISPQPYTGEPIIPELKLYITAGQTKTYLTEGEDYEIAGCYDNIQKGTATILIKGKDTGGCSGIKAVTFKITAADNAKIWSGVF